jgi:hypothetical protein
MQSTRRQWSRMPRIGTWDEVTRLEVGRLFPHSNELGAVSSTQVGVLVRGKLLLQQQLLQTVLIIDEHVSDKTSLIQLAVQVERTQVAPEAVTALMSANEQKCTQIHTRTRTRTHR